MTTTLLLICVILLLLGIDATGNSAVDMLLRGYARARDWVRRMLRKYRSRQ